MKQDTFGEAEDKADWLKKELPKGNDFRDDATHTGQRGLEVDRKFHKVYLESGNMPVAWLRRVFVERGMLPA